MIKKYQTNTKKDKGFATLTSTIVVGGIALIVSISLLIIGQSSYEVSATIEDATKARSLADSCVEYAINKLKIDDEYPGNETLTFDEGSCEILNIPYSGNNNRIIKTIGSYNNAESKVYVELTHINPFSRIDLWEEVADF